MILAIVIIICCFIILGQQKTKPITNTASNSQSEQSSTVVSKPEQSSTEVSQSSQSSTETSQPQQSNIAEQQAQKQMQPLPTFSEYSNQSASLEVNMKNMIWLQSQDKMTRGEKLKQIDSWGLTAAVSAGYNPASIIITSQEDKKIVAMMYADNSIYLPYQREENQ